MESASATQQHLPRVLLAEDEAVTRRLLEAQLPASSQAGITPIGGSRAGQPTTWNQALLELLDDPTIASKRWV